MAIGGEELGFLVQICRVRAGEISEGEEGRRIVGGGDSKSYQIFGAGKIVDGDFFFGGFVSGGEELFARERGRDGACGREREGVRHGRSSAITRDRAGDRAQSPGIAREGRRSGGRWVEGKGDLDRLRWGRDRLR